MKVVILTSSLNGNAAFQLEQLLISTEISVEMVIYNQGEIINKRKFYQRKISKIMKVGLIGALNGIRMRKWYSRDAKAYLNVAAIDQICLENNIRFKRTPTINCKRTISLFKEANADIGLSLGNGYIGSKVFNIPKYGMLNVHHEQLPAYQNAQSVIWQIFNGKSFTGYTIHKINKKIDAGEIIYQEMFPIEFRKDLADTVSYNYSLLWKRSALGMIVILEDFHYYFNNGNPQNHQDRNVYTTPTIFQFFRIKKRFNALKKIASL